MLLFCYIILLFYILSCGTVVLCLKSGLETPFYKENYNPRWLCWQTAPNIPKNASIHIVTLQ